MSHERLLIVGARRAGARAAAALRPPGASGPVVLPGASSVPHGVRVHALGWTGDAGDRRGLGLALHAGAVRA